MQIDWSSRQICRLDHPLLSKHEFLRWKFLAELIAFDNDTARVLEDALELVHGF